MSGKMTLISRDLLALKNGINSNDKFFHFTLCILPVLSADPCSAQGAVGKLATFWAYGSCCEILWGHARLAELSVCWIWASAATGRGEHFTADMTERQADSLLRTDLWKCFEHFKGFGKDALLLTLLAYNVGVGRLLAVLFAFSAINE